MEKNKNNKRLRDNNKNSPNNINTNNNINNNNGIRYSNSLEEYVQYDLSSSQSSIYSNNSFNNDLDISDNSNNSNSSQLYNDNDDDFNNNSIIEYSINNNSNSNNNNNNNNKNNFNNNILNNFFYDELVNKIQILDIKDIKLNESLSINNTSNNNNQIKYSEVVFWKVWKSRSIIKNILSFFNSKLSVNYESLFTISEILFKYKNGVQILMDKVKSGQYLLIRNHSNDIKLIFETININNKLLYNSNDYSNGSNIGLDNDGFEFYQLDNQQNYTINRIKLFYNQLFLNYNKQFIENKEKLIFKSIETNNLIALKSIIKSFKIMHIKKESIYQFINNYNSTMAISTSNSITSLKSFKYFINKIKIVINNNNNNNYQFIFSNLNNNSSNIFKLLNYLISIEFLNNESIINSFGSILELYKSINPFKEYFLLKNLIESYKLIEKILEVNDGLLECDFNELGKEGGYFMFNGEVYNNLKLMISKIKLNNLELLNISKHQLNSKLTGLIILKDSSLKIFIKSLLDIYFMVSEYFTINKPKEYYYCFDSIENFNYQSPESLNNYSKININDSGLLFSYMEILEYGDYNQVDILFKYSSKNNKFLPICREVYNLLNSKVYSSGNNENQNQPILFKYCTNRERQIEFIKQCSNSIIYNKDQFNRMFSPLLLVVLLVDYDDLELIKIAIKELDEKLINNINDYSEVLVSDNSGSNNSNNIKEIIVTDHIKSKIVLEYLFNNLNQLFLINTHSVWLNFQSLELLQVYEELLIKSKLYTPSINKISIQNIQNLQLSKSKLPIDILLWVFSNKLDLYQLESQDIFYILHRFSEQIFFSKQINLECFKKLIISSTNNNNNNQNSFNIFLFKLFNINSYYSNNYNNILLQDLKILDFIFENYNNNIIVDNDYKNVYQDGFKYSLEVKEYQESNKSNSSGYQLFIMDEIEYIYSLYYTGRLKDIFENDQYIQLFLESNLNQIIVKRCDFNCLNQLLTSLKFNVNNKEFKEWIIDKIIIRSSIAGSYPIFKFLLTNFNFILSKDYIDSIKLKIILKNLISYDYLDIIEILSNIGFLQLNNILSKAEFTSIVDYSSVVYNNLKSKFQQ